MIKRDECPLCGNCKSQLYFELIVDKNFKDFIDNLYSSESYRILSKFINKSIVYLQCKGCKLIYQSNILSDEGMYELYENIISADESLDKRLNFSLKHHKNSVDLLFKILKKIDKKVSEITVVDLGMGFGQMLSYTKALGCINSYGIELSDFRINFAKEKFGIESFNSLDKFKDNSIDFMISNQSLEHIPNLRETLDLIEKKLAVGGYIYIAVPDGSKKQNILSKGAFQPFEHINTFIATSYKYLFSSSMKKEFMLKNLSPKNKTTWLFKKVR